jgi:hypothetical protein
MSPSELPMKEMARESQSARKGVFVRRSVTAPAEGTVDMLIVSSRWRTAKGSQEWLL